MTTAQNRTEPAVNRRLGFEAAPYLVDSVRIRAVANLTVPGGQEFHFPYCFLKFRSIFLIFPQTLLIFFLILALRVGESNTREGPRPLVRMLHGRWIMQKVLLGSIVLCLNINGDDIVETILKRPGGKPKCLARMCFAVTRAIWLSTSWTCQGHD